MNKIFTIFVLLVCTLSLNAQTTITWKGGTPGKESSWNEPRNWDKNRVPNDLDKVIIRLENNGHYSMPEILNSAIVAWLEIQSGASLNITESGELIVDGRYTYSEGITLRGGLINSEGNITLIGIDQEFEEQNRKFMLNSYADQNDLIQNGNLIVKGH